MGGRHCMAGQYGYVSFGQHLVIYKSMLLMPKQLSGNANLLSRVLVDGSLMFGGEVWHFET